MSVKCLVPHCRRIRYRRGLCARCFYLAEKKSGGNWSDMERKGLSLPPVKACGTLYGKYRRKVG